MSVISYNGITLPYSSTTTFDQSPVRDEMGQTDWCGTKFDIQVQCILNINYMSTIAPSYTSATPANAADVMKLIRYDLLQHRKSLSFKVNGVELIPQKAGVQGTVDIRNGPIPQSCVINQLTTETFLVTYHVIAEYWENYTRNAGSSDTTPDTTTNNPGHPVLFNRWTETIEIDNCLYTKRIREGMYRIRSDNNDGVLADEMRSNMAVVGVPLGFLRESSSYTVTPNGLGIKYRVVDKEYFKHPPFPAHEAKGYYIESTTNKGAVRHGECFLRLKGRKDVPQHLLLEKAMAIVAAKLYVNGAGVENTPKGKLRFSLPKFGIIKADMFENIVEVHYKVMLNKQKERYAGLASFTGPIVNTPGVDFSTASKPPEYLDRGTASLLLQAAAYYDPNLNGNVLAGGNTADSINPITGTANNRSQINGPNSIQPGQAGTNPEA